MLPSMHELSYKRFHWHIKPLKPLQTLKETFGIVESKTRDPNESESRSTDDTGERGESRQESSFENNETKTEHPTNMKDTSEMQEQKE